MKSFKVKAIIEIKYEINPEYYPENSTLDDMISLDLANLEDDPYTFLDSDDVSYRIEKDTD